MIRKYRIWNIPFQQYERDNLWSLKPDGTIMWGSAEWPEAIVEWDTGFKDRNMKRIYQHDICKIMYDNMFFYVVIMWNLEEGRFDWVGTNNSGEFNVYMAQKCEIAGDINQNFDLVKDGFYNG